MDKHCLLIYLVMLYSVSHVIHCNDEDRAEDEYQINCEIENPEEEFKKLENLILNVEDSGLEETIHILFHNFGTYNFLQFALPPAQIADISLGRFHPDSIVNVRPTTEENTITHKSSGGGRRHTFEGAGGNIDMLFKIVNERLKEENPKKRHTYIWWVNTAEGEERKVGQKFKDVLREVNDKDVVLVEPNNVDMKELHKGLCFLKPKWAIYKQGRYALLKSIKLGQADKVDMPSLPKSLEERNKMKMRNAFVDVILYTNNNPMQTMALVESLLKFGKGIKKVWMIQSTKEKHIKEGYELVKSCFKQLDISIVEEGDDKVGEVLMDTLNQLISNYVIFLKENNILTIQTDFKLAANLLSACGRDCFAFQLRSSKAEGIENKIPEERFVKLSDVEGIFAYMPTHLPGKVGSVAHLDGILVGSKDILKEFSRKLPKMKSREQIETYMRDVMLHTRCRQWQLIYERNHFFDTATLNIETEKHIDTTALLVDNHKKIDVQSFVKQLEDTGTSIDFSFQNYDCEDMKQENEQDAGRVEVTEDACRHLPNDECCAVEIYSYYIEHTNRIDCQFDFTKEEVLLGYEKLTNVIPDAKSGFFSTVKHMFKTFKPKAFVQLPTEITEDVRDDLRKAYVPEAASLVSDEERTVTMTVNPKRPLQGLYKGGGGGYRFLLHTLYHADLDKSILFWLNPDETVQMTSKALLEIMTHIKKNSLVVFEYGKLDLYDMYNYMCRQKSKWAIFKQDKYVVLKLFKP